MKIIADGKEYLVTDKRGMEIKAAILSENPPDWIDLGGVIVRSFKITSFSKGGYTEADRVINPARQLRANSRDSTRQYSDARKAADIARKELIRKGIIKK